MCEFCNGSYEKLKEWKPNKYIKHRIDIKDYNRLEVSEHDIRSVFSTSKLYIEINYCPMCGEKLSNE